MIDMIKKKTVDITKKNFQLKYLLATLVSYLEVWIVLLRYELEKYTYKVWIQIILKYEAYFFEYDSYFKVWSILKFAFFFSFTWNVYFQSMNHTKKYEFNQT